MDFSILETILSVFLTALLVTVIFRQLHLPVILGYLLVGALMGPHAIGIVPDSSYVKDLAEFGIVLLMFTVGLEFSLPKLFALRFSVFFIGGLQVFITLLAFIVIGHWIGLTLLTSIVMSCIAAMSSTALVIKQLQDQLELNSPAGLNAVGILLFQDLAVIPFIILISGLATHSEHSLPFILLWALLKGIFAIMLIFTLGRWLLRPFFHLISKTRAIELFTLTVLLVSLTSAWLTHILGLSFALGAFLAGMMLSETEFRHQIEVEIRPFRDILLGLFFITVGMLTDISTWHTTWMWISIMLVALVPGKIVLITLISRIAKNELFTSLRTGIILAQGGEFGFAILTLAISHDVLPPEYGQVILAALLISIACAPILIYFNKRISTFLLPLSKKIRKKELLEWTLSTTQLKHHVILCGYGRVGQHIARLLDSVKFPYLAIDLDAKLVQHASLAGEHVIYGNPSHPEILKKAGIETARIVVICISDYPATLHILQFIRNSYPTLPVLVRCHDETELKQLKALGATEVIAELFEESLTLSQHLLNLIDIPEEKTTQLIREVRRGNYDLLQKVFTNTEEESEVEQLNLHEQLMPILIPHGAYAEYRKLVELNLKNIEVVAVRRGEEKFMKPHGNLKLRSNDIIIMYGKTADLENAERKILEGV